MGLADDLERARPAKERIGKLADLLERSGIDVDDIGRVDKINVWQGFLKDADGNAQTVDMAGIVLTPAWADGPAWPVVRPAPAVRVPVSKVHPKAVDGWQTAIVLPDMQCGYFRATSGELVATHDETALDIALALIRHHRPSVVVLHGDNADFPELSRYRLSPAYALTTQATIDRLGLLGAQLRAAAGPDARIVWLAGNHEERLPNYIIDNARAAFGLRQANTPESWPVLSMPHLCRMDDHGVEFLPGYPASAFWINERLKVIHGELVASGGSTAHKYLAREKTSVLFGHVHRIEYAERTRDDHDGPRTVMAASSGCLARTDGVVPSTKGGIDLDGRPVVRHEDWQQGVGVVEFEPGDGRFVFHTVPIRNGWARWQGRTWEAS